MISLFYLESIKIRNMPKYIISLQDHETYPFEGIKQHCSEVIVRKSFNFASKEEEKTLTTHLNIILSLPNEGIIQIVRVLEKKSKSFIIDYEYVGENLKNCQKLEDKSWLQRAKEALKGTTQQLAQVGIKIDLKIQDIGVTPEGLVKLYLPLNFDIVSEVDQKLLAQEYQGQVERLFEQNFNFRCSMKAHSQISDYSYRLDKKITQIQDKLNRRRRRSKGGRSSTQKAESSSDQAKKPNIPQDCQSSKHSNGSMTSQKTWYSQIDAKQLVKPPKTHKRSFNDFPTTSHKLNQPGATEDSLKKRLTTALEKTQEAFKIYDKHFKRGKKF